MREFIVDCLFLLFMCGSVPLLVAAVVGVVISTVQAVTQIQEQSVGFLARLFALSAVFFLFGSKGWELAVGVIQKSLALIVVLGR